MQQVTKRKRDRFQERDIAASHGRPAGIDTIKLTVLTAKAWTMKVIEELNEKPRDYLK